MKSKLFYLNIITTIGRFTRVSKAVSLALALNQNFVEEIIRRMAVKESRGAGEVSNPQVVKQGLEILLNLSSAHSTSRDFIDSHNLHPLLVQIGRIAKNRNLVIIEDIVDTLLNIYNTNDQFTSPNIQSM
jgi:hypothetical protein